MQSVQSVQSAMIRGRVNRCCTGAEFRWRRACGRGDTCWQHLTGCCRSMMGEEIGGVSAKGRRFWENGFFLSIASSFGVLVTGSCQMLRRSKQLSIVPTSLNIFRVGSRVGDVIGHQAPSASRSSRSTRSHIPQASRVGIVSTGLLAVQPGWMMGGMGGMRHGSHGFQLFHSNLDRAGIVLSRFFFFVILHRDPTK